MGFFAFNEGKLVVSPVVWMYPSIVVPLTIAVFGAWLAWIKFRPVKFKEKREHLYSVLEQEDSVAERNQTSGTV